MRYFEKISEEKVVNLNMENFKNVELPGENLNKLKGDLLLKKKYFLPIGIGAGAGIALGGGYLLLKDKNK